jgi:xanthine dehydrogenase YagS FAD-binding subunit
MNRFAWMRAPTVSQAAAAASATVAAAMTLSPDAMERGEIAIVQAGGIDVLDLLKEGLLAPRVLVGLKGIPGLDRIAADQAGGLRIGALVTLATLAAHPDVARRYPALAEAVGTSASPQIRNVATLGGNLLQRPRCWYFRAEAYRCLRKGGGHCFALAGDNRYHAVFDNHPCAIVHPSTAATALVALDASVELAGRDGDVRRLRLEEFFVLPDQDLQRENDLRPHEILTAIRLPPVAAGVRMAHVKQAERAAFDWPLVDVAVRLDLAPDGTCRAAAVILGAVAPAPRRAAAAERVLIGQPINDAAARRAGQAALEGATPLADNAYKLALVEVLVRRAILAAVARA